MKNLFFVIILVSLCSCVSVNKHNEILEIPISVKNLKKDVDFAQQKLEQLHPNLYGYISQKDLNHQFDSLKTTIKKPLKPNEFYQKLAPIISKVRQGHLRLYPYEKRLTKKQINHLKKQKGLLGRFNFVVQKNQIFVKDNADKIPNMNVGTEILKIKDIPVAELLRQYDPIVNSDGYNTTFQKYSMARRWPVFFTSEYGILDSVKLETKYQNQVKTFYLHREKITTEEKKATQEKNKKLTKSESGKTKDYNIQTKSYNRDLQFPKQDSSVAYLKIKTFSGTYSRKFYKQSFAIIKKSSAKYLILDIRDNLGGSLSEINNLYSYLVDKPFKFIEDMEVTSRYSLYHANYFKDLPTFVKPLAAITYPLYLIGTGLSVKKKEEKFYLRNNGLFSIKNPKKNHFEGKVYVLINGSSFSASSIIASKLKDAKRAFLVGEETGGANDGTVAGRYSTEKLPYSKLQFPIGLMLVQPHIQFTETQKGVVPDQEILLTLSDVLQKKDLELAWIMADINAAEKNQ